jgi:nucleoid-associated protein YgaU
VARGEGPDTTVAPSKETSTEAEVVAGGVARGEGPDTTVAPSKETPPAKPAREAAWRGRGGRYAGPHRIHVVVRGEYLYKIAGYAKYFGDPERWSVIYEVNAYQIKDPHWIFIGQRLQVPTP